MRWQGMDLHGNREALIQDDLHMAAFGNNSPLGRPVYLDVAEVQRIHPSAVQVKLQ